VSKVDYYRQILHTLDDWDPFLLQESGLPGPRANLELLQAVADEGSEAQFRRWLTLGPDRAPVNSPQQFLAVCGVVGLGRLLAEGHDEVLPILRDYASDPRWRMREGVAMALQRLGDRDMDALLAEMASWSQGNWLEKRAAAAGLCEPRLLTRPQHAQRVLQLLDDITTSVAAADDRKNDDFKTLRQALGYCWSVVVAALPTEGKAAMEKWVPAADSDVAWIMKENLKKKRLQRIDPAWVDALARNVRTD
jgi:3-methyladenine DNA glycosylase AlkC